jgi:hypothetical protein
MTPTEIADFIATQKVGVVCGHDGAGVLTARRCEVEQVGDRLQLKLWPETCSFDLSGHREVCVAIDTYPSHDGIKGVIMSGKSAPSDEAALITVDMQRVVSFDFSKGDTGKTGAT